jgi:hypothetical protein
VIVPDAVAVYRISGLSLDAIFALFRIVVTSVIIVLTIRIPFKRKYHWMFLVVSFAFLWFSVFSFAAQTSATATTALTFFQLQGFLANSPQYLLIFQFVIYFVGRKATLWEKAVLVAGYGYCVVTVWVPYFIDPNFSVELPHQTTFGWTTSPGTGNPYLVPSGIDIFDTTLVLLSFYLLLRYYRSAGSPLVKGQVKYLIIGIILIFVGSSYHFLIAQRFTLPALQNLISGGGDIVLLLGLKKKGFYSVTPTTETATIAAPVTYPLEDGQFYLAFDTKACLDAFSNTVKNGHEGLLITRTFPDDARRDTGLMTTPIRWLAESKRDDAMSPVDLLGLSLTVKDFLQKAMNPVVMLQGIEYLTTINGFEPNLRLIQGLRDANAEKRGILLLPVVPKSLDEKDEALLVAETSPLPSPTV